jgi:hypothetical protein
LEQSQRKGCPPNSGFCCARTKLTVDEALSVFLLLDGDAAFMITLSLHCCFSSAFDSFESIFLRPSKFLAQVGRSTPLVKVEN